MRNWKRRGKCALALLVAAALVGSNADGLLLSAFAEENTYDADSQPVEAEEDSEGLWSETSTTEPARGGIFLKDMEETLLGDEQQAVTAESSEEDGQKESTAESSEEDGQKESTAESSEEDDQKESTAESSEEDGRKESTAETSEQDGQKADTADASEGNSSKESAVKPSEDSRNEGQAEAEDGRQEGQVESSANGQEEPEKSSADAEQEETADSSADGQEETAASSEDEQEETEKSSVDERKEEAETSSSDEQNLDTEASSDNKAKNPEGAADSEKIENPAEPSEEAPQKESAEGTSEDEQTEIPEENFETVEITVVPEADIPDNDELFEGYVYQLFYGNDDISLYGNVGGDRLTGDEKIIYDTLKTQIKEIASGNRSSTEDIAISGVKILSTQVKSTVSQVMAYLLMDCPYDLYWYDKTVGVAMAYSLDDTGMANSLYISMAVAKEYRGSSESIYIIDTQKVQTAASAAANAKAIVDRHDTESDYDKLKSYLTEICNLVSYNNEAAEATSPDYGNPWQMIWVFDGDESTKVVCEGYSKAFQYLCDLSDFQDVACYTVTGVMAGGTGAGGHMWNIVTIGGMNYLVDVTNCDEGTVGAPDQLFLTGTSGSVADGYTFSLNNGRSQIKYTYDDGLSALMGDVLKLADTPYQNHELLKVNVKAPAVTVTYGDTVDNSVLNETSAGGSAQTADGTPVDGTFSWAGVTSYGNAGSKELKAVFTPDDTTQYQTITDVTVTVTVNPKAITVTAQDTEKTYGTDDPEFSYTVTEGSVVSGDSLSVEFGREQGEDVREGGYAITPGNPAGTVSNYNITFINGTLTIKPAVCTVAVSDDQNILQEKGEFTEPTFTGVKGEVLTGQLTYSYGTQSQAVDYNTLKAELATLETGTTGTIQYSFKPESANYNLSEGKFNFTVKDIIFTVNGVPATVANAVSIKTDSVYGDDWANIVTIGNITAAAGAETDSRPENFTLSVSGMPNAGTQDFEVWYSGTLGGKEFTRSIVCAGTVNVAERTITVSAGSYKVSKTYDRTAGTGTVTGALEVSGILSKDTGVTVTTVPVDYTNPNVGGQTQMVLPLTLNGDIAGNYRLGSNTVTVPCEILPMVIAPILEITGTYSYTGQAIVPELTVSYTMSDSAADTLGETDYVVALSDNMNAGTAKVSVTPKAGGNYTWANAVEGTFDIAKIDYPYATTAELCARYGNEATFDLASMLPSGYVLGTVSAADSDGILAGTPAVNGSVLSYKMSSDRVKVGKTAVITVPVIESTNYRAFELALTVTLSDKLEQTDFRFSQSALNKTYGDGDFAAEVVNAADGSTLSFTSSNPNVAIVDNNGKVQILSAGTTAITAWASETNDYMRGTAVCTLNVAPRALAWDTGALSAADKEGTITNQKASLYGELRVTGILDADKGAVSFSCPADRLTGTYAAAEPGAQKVLLSWADAENPAVLQGEKAANYVLPAALPEVTGKINAVSTVPVPPAESTAQVQFSLSMESGISQVPAALAGIESLNTPEKIEAQMKLNIRSQAASVSQENTAVYDVTLMVNVDGAGWQAAGKDNFPADGLTITLPYPEGTGRDANDFVVCHLFTEDMNGHKAGEVEYPAVTKTDAGIRFKVYGLSPISVGWTKAGELNNMVEVKESGTASEPAGSQQSAAPESPKTSDENPIALYLIAMLVSGGLLAGMVFGRRRRINNRK